MSGKITILGSGTCQLQKERMASSVLIELDDVRIVFDFGRGICQRLLDAGLKQDQVRHIVISHFHPDHISDLIPYLQAAAWSRIDPRKQDLTVYGPIGLKKTLDQLVGSSRLKRKRFSVQIRELGSGSFGMDNRRFSFQRLPHPGPWLTEPDNHGLEFSYQEKRYVLTGDAAFTPEAVNFIKGAELAIIDAGHIRCEEIVKLAALSQVKTLVCSHLYNELDAGELNRAAGIQGFKGRIAVAHDLLSFSLT